MPVTDLHVQYSNRASQWERCRDSFEGTDAIKSRTTMYLPRLGGQRTEEYEAYLLRAMWYGATGRTVLGLTGSVMRKPPKVEAPEALLTHFDDITLTAMDLPTFAGLLVQEVLTLGRLGILLDMPKGVTGETPRPVWVKYDAEQITNWRWEDINGRRQLTLVVLREEYENSSVDIFQRTCIYRYRVLLIVGGVYMVRLYENIGENQAWYITEELTPQVRGATLDYIPFTFINAMNLNAEVYKPPLLDLADVNLSHFRSSADLEHGRHFTALPTPYITGAPKETSLKIGSSVAWAIPSHEARVGMLEFTGAGLGALEKALESKERMMAVLGARMLEEQKRAVEAAETHTIRQSGESSLLASIANMVSAGMTLVARWHANWLGTKEGNLTTVQLNTDFYGTPLSSADLASLLQAFQGGAISYETLYYNLERGELTRPGILAEIERAQIENEAPMLDLVNPGQQDQPPGSPNSPPQKGQPATTPAKA